MLPLLSGALALWTLLPATAATDAGTIELTYKPYRRFDLALPAERFTPVGAGFAVQHERGERFAVEIDGASLRCDTDGDGHLDQTLEGREQDGSRVAFVTLRGRGLDSHPITYSARLVDRGGGWEYAAGGAQLGAIAGVPLRLIDQDNNGRYDDFGSDALIVGDGRCASFLSEVVNVAGTLYRITIRPDGRELSYQPFTDAAGDLDLTSGCTANARLKTAIVRSVDGRYSFDVAAGEGRLRVPAASYQLITGEFGQGSSTVRVTTGRSGFVRVRADESTVLTWGGPVQAEFQVAKQGEQIALLPELIHYFGVFGEEYSAFKPFGASPAFSVRDKQLGTEIDHAIFGGC